MKVRITFRSEIYIEGETIKDVREKFENIQLFNPEAVKENALDYVELVSVEDDVTYEDLEEEYMNAYNPTNGN